MTQIQIAVRLSNLYSVTRELIDCLARVRLVLRRRSTKEEWRGHYSEKNHTDHGVTDSDYTELVRIFNSLPTLLKLAKERIDDPEIMTMVHSAHPNGWVEFEYRGAASYVELTLKLVKDQFDDLPIGYRLGSVDPSDPELILLVRALSTDPFEEDRECHAVVAKADQFGRLIRCLEDEQLTINGLLESHLPAASDLREPVTQTPTTTPQRGGKLKSREQLKKELVELALHTPRDDAPKTGAFIYESLDISKATFYRWKNEDPSINRIINHILAPETCSPRRGYTRNGNLDGIDVDSDED